LDNPVWWSLVSRHQALAVGSGRARQYRSDISVFAAMVGFDEAAWFDLAKLVGPARGTVLFGGGIPAEYPSGWVGGERIPCRQMTIDGAALARVPPVPLRRLGPDDVPLMLELVALTKPGPFRSGTIEMGQYDGHFEGPRLVAMAGERLGFDGYTEISAVCTHPDVQGRGLGTALTHHVASRILQRGERPFLHVAEWNQGARRVYENLGFVASRYVDAVVVTTPSAS
jgi:GNAT superfamily N-acetyltransferase